MRGMRGMSATDEVSPPAAELYASSVVIDGLDTSRWGSETVFRSLRDGGVTAINATTAIWEGFEAAMDNLARWFMWFEQYSEYIRPVRSVADIYAAKKEGRTGVIFGWQNATPVEDDIERFRLFHQLGVRIAQLTYNERNLFGNGCWERTDEGLSRIGQAAVCEMNRLGILIDLSHCGDRTTLETIESSERPCAITHAIARSQYLCSDFMRPRLKSDEAIRRLAERAGVVGASSFPNFFPNAFDSTLGDFLDAIDYLVDMVGIEHVGIGNDFCMEQPRSWFDWLLASHGKRPNPEPASFPQPYRHLRGLDGPKEFVNVTEGLLRRGYSPDDVRKLLGENWLRLFGRVWCDQGHCAGATGRT